MSERNINRLAPKTEIHGLGRRVGAIILSGLAVFGVAKGVEAGVEKGAQAVEAITHNVEANLQDSSEISLPTIKEYDHDAKLHDKFKRIAIRPAGVGADDLAKRYMPDAPSDAASKALTNEDKQNDADGQGAPGFGFEDPLIVPRPNTDNQELANK